MRPTRNILSKAFAQSTDVGENVEFRPAPKRYWFCTQTKSSLSAPKRYTPATSSITKPNVHLTAPLLSQNTTWRSQCWAQRRTVYLLFSLLYTPSLNVVEWAPQQPDANATAVKSVTLSLHCTKCQRTMPKKVFAQLFSKSAFPPSLLPNDLYYSTPPRKNY